MTVLHNRKGAPRLATSCRARGVRTAAPPSAPRRTHELTRRREQHGEQPRSCPRAPVVSAEPAESGIIVHVTDVGRHVRQLDVRNNDSKSTPRKSPDTRR